MSISKETLFDVITAVIALTIIILAILHFATNIEMHSKLPFILNAIFLSLMGFKKVKDKNLFGYFLFIPALLLLLPIVQNLAVSF